MGDNADITNRKKNINKDFSERVSNNNTGRGNIAEIYCMIYSCYDYNSSVHMHITLDCSKSLSVFSTSSDM